MYDKVKLSLFSVNPLQVYCSGVPHVAKHIKRKIQKKKKKNPKKKKPKKKKTKKERKKPGTGDQT